MKVTLVIPFFLLFLHASAQTINPLALYNTWKLDKYSDAEEYYLPPQKEMKDYISFRKDSTYKAVSEGQAVEGSWILNTNGQYIELKATNGKKEKLYLHFLSDQSMVVTYDTDEYRIWEVHYVSSK
ncbi:MAG: hypothetical protein AAGG75_15795 [Bacteroidota bacterium]